MDPIRRAHDRPLKRKSSVGNVVCWRDMPAQNQTVGAFHQFGGTNSIVESHGESHIGVGQLELEVLGTK